MKSPPFLSPNVLNQQKALLYFFWLRISPYTLTLFRCAWPLKPNHESSRPVRMLLAHSFIQFNCEDSSLISIQSVIMILLHVSPTVIIFMSKPVFCTKHWVSCILLQAMKSCWAQKAIFLCLLQSWGDAGFLDCPQLSNSLCSNVCSMESYFFSRLTVYYVCTPHKI